MCAVPMSWGAGLCWGLRFALLCGATLVSMERWDLRLTAELIDKEGGTFIYGPPTMARDLVDLADEWRPAGPLKMICVGAPIPRQMCVDARERLGLSLIPGYGQTEHLHSVLGRLDDPIEKLTDSDGRAIPHDEVRAVDDDGNEMKPGGRAHSRSAVRTWRAATSTSPISLSRRSVPTGGRSPRTWARSIVTATCGSVEGSETSSSVADSTSARARSRSCCFDCPT
ncbi:MAG: AMP-binding protein [Actinobacteria bacterium]|nr:AMP-binding protein [Actinomycetota bacterium]